MKSLNNSISFLFIIIAISFIFSGCSSQKKVTTETKKPTAEKEEYVEEETPKTINDRGCEMYGEDGKKKALVALTLYREDFKAKIYDAALPNWEYLFNNAPGLREQVFKDGDVMFKKMLDEETDPTKKKELFDKMMEISDQRAICWGKSAFLSGKKAYSYYKYYPEQEDKIFEFAEKSVLDGGNDTPASQLKLYFRYVLKRLKDQKLNKDELTEAYNNIKAIIDHNLEQGNTEYQEALDEIQPTYENLIDVLNPTTISIKSCVEAKDYYGQKFNENPEDLSNIKKLYSAFLNFKCYDDPMFLQVTDKYNQLEPKASRLKTQGNIYRKQKDYAKALEFYQKAFDIETDNIKKSKIKMLMATMTAYDLPGKDFPTARKHAKEAADLNPNWGKPYILIGRMYAGSGKLCGPGTGFESQKVLWPAMDMWNKAKKIDPSSADEAQKYINQYYQYMPEKKDLFQRSITPGSSYSIGCWIGGTSIARGK